MNDTMQLISLNMPRLTVAGIWTLITAVGLFLLREVLPSYAKDGIKSAVTSAIGYQKHKRQLFMLKAIGHGARRDIVGQPFTLDQIEHNLTVFQIEETYGGTEMIGRAVFGQLNPEQQRKIEKNRKAQRRLGIPDAEEGVPSAARLKKIESILQEMVRDGKLRFNPPNSYAVL